MHPDVELAVQEIDQSEASHQDENDPEDLSELLPNGMVIELEPDAADADDSPDASTGSRAKRVRLEDG